MDFGNELRSRLEGICELSAAQVALLGEHFELLQRWNARMNLTSIRRPAEVIERHYCESVFVGCHLPEGEVSVVDIGSGAGFPGVGVAVSRPRARVTLVESSHRKAAFLKESSRNMGNVKVRTVRGEDLTEEFDWVVSRAVAWEGLPLPARNVALLSTEPGPQFAWRERIRVPWGERRVLLIGDVPRETPD